MSTARPFAYNLGGPISGTTQTGNLAIGVADQDYSSGIGGVQWWMGPDEDLGYVIAEQVPSGNQPNPLGIPAYVGFYQSSALTESSFVELTNYLFNQNFTTGSQSKNYLNTNGYWTSYGESLITPTPTNTPTLTPTNTPTNTETPTVTPTNTPTETETPTPTPTITQTPSPTETEPFITPTNTPTETETPTPTITQTPTSSETQTPTPTPTPTPSGGDNLIDPIITQDDEYIEVGNNEYLMF